ncbi:hypothetical protein ASPBRDRAFT_27670 [Aspergillus brasiliensis CBS 101740]|uniref:Transcription factor domain-containing protein n=1 Tax=Aspergillus brasiliensis (strain CBS 101740 / IMI 381727 / IBT 21946) TaxID=767769 RepID=A0A1L9USK1_ASPBC|nr:hypothetical protein ASPBRDRAFT_27670 [Aspergillus brasiliensis CBS 101740]
MSIPEVKGIRESKQRDKSGYRELTIASVRGQGRCVQDVSIEAGTASISSLWSQGLDVQRNQQDSYRRFEVLGDSVHHKPEPQSRLSGLSQLGRTVNEDTSLDELATHAFSETSLGHLHFGPSSNYAMFRHISNAFAEIALVHLTLGDNAHTAQHCSTSEASIKSASGKAPKGKHFSVSLEDIHALPSRDEVLYLISRFSTTIGEILPYIDYGNLLDTYEKALLERPPRFQRGFLALLNIVWAHASASLQLPEAELFYSHCAGLLDQRTVERPTFELEHNYRWGFIVPLVDMLVIKPLKSCTDDMDGGSEQ